MLWTAVYVPLVSPLSRYIMGNGYCYNRRNDKERFDIVNVIVKLHYRYRVLNRLVRTDNIIYFMRTYFLNGFSRLQLELKHWNTVIMSTPLFTLMYAAGDAEELRNEQWFQSNIGCDLLSKHSKCWFSKRVPKRKWETMINHTCQAPEEIHSHHFLAEGRLVAFAESNHDGHLPVMLFYITA